MTTRTFQINFEITGELDLQAIEDLAAHLQSVAFAAHATIGNASVTYDIAEV